MMTNLLFTTTTDLLFGYDGQLNWRTQTSPLSSSTGSLIFSVSERIFETDGSIEFRIFNNREELIFVLR